MTHSPHIEATRSLKVLLISLFHPELVRGGAQQICYELFQGLKRHPHINATLLASIDHSLSSLYKSGATITGFDNREGEFLFLSTEYDYWWHRTSNERMLASYAEFLEIIRPDVVHFHHFLTLGIDLVTFTRRILPDVKIVFTLHDFMAICAADGHMLRKHDGSLCTRASAVRCHQCFPHISPEQFFVRDRWMKRHFMGVDIFTVPTRFMMKHYIDWGLDERRLFYVENAQEDRGADANISGEGGQRNRFGFFGQLVDAKGVHVLLGAVDYLRAGGFTDFIVELNGDNLRFATKEKRDEIERFLAREAEKPQSQRNVVFNGSYQVDQMRARMARVDWCVVPSVWWEVFGLVISESWMFGRPVIVSNVGGPAERVRHGVDGLHFEVGDSRALAETMRRACTEEGLWEKLSGGILPLPTNASMVRKFVALYSERNTDHDLNVESL